MFPESVPNRFSQNGLKTLKSSAANPLAARALSRAFFCFFLKLRCAIICEPKGNFLKITSEVN
jgi:hypothetical protein